MDAEEIANLQLTDFNSTIFVQVNSLLVLTILFTFLPLSLRFLYLDYLAYLSLGPGGTPASLQGFLKVKALGLFALRDPYQPRYCAAAAQHGKGYLNLTAGRLRRRDGARPVVKGIAPQRQTTEKSPQRIYDQVASEIERIAAADSTLTVGTSCFEKHGTGLFLRSSSTSVDAPSPTHTSHRCKHEVVHVHGSDGSMHLVLHPADSRAVLEAGWGERHPLSRGGSFERFVPVDFVMVYAPRDEQEVEMVVRIILAARWFVGGAEGSVEDAERFVVDEMDGEEHRGSAVKDAKVEDETCDSVDARRTVEDLSNPVE